MSSLRVTYHFAVNRFLGRLTGFLGAIFRLKRKPPMNSLHVDEMTDRQMSDIGMIDGRHEKPQASRRTAFDAARTHFIGRGL